MKSTSTWPKARDSFRKGSSQMLSITTQQLLVRRRVIEREREIRSAVRWEVEKRRKKTQSDVICAKVESIIIVWGSLIYRHTDLVNNIMAGSQYPLPPSLNELMGHGVENN